MSTSTNESIRLTRPRDLESQHSTHHSQPFELCKTAFCRSTKPSCRPQRRAAVSIESRAVRLLLGRRRHPQRIAPAKQARKQPYDGPPRRSVVSSQLQNHKRSFDHALKFCNPAQVKSIPSSIEIQTSLMRIAISPTSTPLFAVLIPYGAFCLASLLLVFSVGLSY